QAGWVENINGNSNYTMPAFRCTSDVGSTLVTSPVVAGRSNYVANNGCNLAMNFAVNNPPCTTEFIGTTSCIGGGPFSQNSKLNFRDFHDGLSGTILIGERRSPTAVGTYTVGGDSIWIGPADISPPGVGLVLGDAVAVPNSTNATPYVYSSPHTGGAQFLMG